MALGAVTWLRRAWAQEPVVFLSCFLGILGMTPSKFSCPSPHRTPLLTSHPLPRSAVGLAGPALFATVPPLRRRLGYANREPVPTNYPGTLRARHI